MGGDGGQVIDRATMVKTKGWGLTKGGGDRYANSLGEMANYVQMISEDRGLGFLELRRTRMTNCRVSQNALQEPVVACRLGNLFNKEALIGALLNRSLPAELGHVKALKDVKPCLLTWKEAENEDGRRRMVCPVTREDLDSGGARAVVLWSSGAVVSAKTLKEMKLKECPVTGKPFDLVQDVVQLVPDDEELEKLKERLPTRKRKAECAKKNDVPGEAGATAASASSSAAPATAAAASTAADDDKKMPPPGASKKAKPQRESEKNVEARMAKDANYKSLFSKKSRQHEESAGMNGSRDGFNTPSYFRGSRI